MTRRHITTRRDRQSKRYRDLHEALARECKMIPWWRYD